MLPDPVLDLLRHQRGLAAKHQIRVIEPNRSARRAIYGNPDLAPIGSRVLQHRAVPWTPEQPLMAAVLDGGPDALLWGKSGACQFGFGRFRRLPPHVATVRRCVRDDHLGQLHLLRDLDPRDRTVHQDIPIARPESIVLWLCGMWTHRFGHDFAEKLAATALDQAWRQRLIDGHFIHELAERSGGSGHSGIVVLRALLDERPPDYKPAGSALEERFESIVPWVVRRDLERQVTVDVEPVIRTVDYRLRRWPLVAEINGEVFHTSLTDRAADEERYAHLLSQGYSVVVFWEYDVWHDARVVADAMLRLYNRPDELPTLHRPTPAPWEW